MCFLCWLTENRVSQTRHFYLKIVTIFLLNKSKNNQSHVTSYDFPRSGKSVIRDS